MRPTPLISLLGAGSCLSTKLQVRQLTDLEAELFGKAAAALLARYREGKPLSSAPVLPGEGIASSVPTGIDFAAGAEVLLDAQEWLLQEVFHVEQARLVRVRIAGRRLAGTFVDHPAPGLVPDSADR